ncbi:hypothetical protein [Mixta theicola]|uniref:hypothetical protein n=1 Tax=Mixta theicola TaxID=1458355 RepID=UPI0013FD7509|nr:hypothetical protein [Mixta theicola]
MTKTLKIALSSLLLSGGLLSASASAFETNATKGCAIICNDNGVCINVCDPGVHP